MLKITLQGDTAALLQGARQLADAGVLSLGGGLTVTAVKQDKGLSVKAGGDKATIQYSRPAEFFRGLSYLIQGELSVEETPVFKDNGLMLDCSRNAVASLDSVKLWLRMMALMGLTTLQLYTEDTYEIPEWPYFGYQRGRYTGDELKELDAYAGALGIELIPCIQTLAHLNAALHWVDFHDIIDCGDILLAGSEKTYRLIDDMLRQLASCHKTRRIHIGMDEAHMLGLGRYLDLHGYQNRSEIMCNHLAKVVTLCKKYGFQPMMWSDMFFRLAAGDYYAGGDIEIPPEVLELLPPEVSLVYWDYYHLNEEHYGNMLRTHKKFPNDIVFAGGAWKWGGLCPELNFSVNTSRAALTACVANGVDSVFATAWGDNGAECPAMTVLPAVQYYAEFGYNGGDGGRLTDSDGQATHFNGQTGVKSGTGSATDFLKKRFAACTGGVWDDFFLMDRPNNTTPTRPGTHNPTKYMLYQDVLLGLFDLHIDPETFPQHFADCRDELAAAAGRNGQFGYLFDHYAALCDVLARKCTLGIEITAAYRGGDKAALKKLAEVELPAVSAKVDKLVASFERVWLTEDKPQGLEVIHLRLGGLKERLAAAARRIGLYLDGTVDRLEELEAERLGFNGPIQPGEDINTHSNLWHAIVSASPVSH